MSVVERYLELGLRVGKHVDELVESYYGPPEVAARVEAEQPLAPETLKDDAGALLADLAHADVEPARRRWLEALREEGLDAQPEDEIGIVVPVGGSDGELFHQVEGVVFSVGAPFVPIEHEGVIYIRPPVG